MTTSCDGTRCKCRRPECDERRPRSRPQEQHDSMLTLILEDSRQSLRPVKSVIRMAAKHRDGMKSQVKTKRLSRGAGSSPIGRLDPKSSSGCCPGGQPSATGRGSGSLTRLALGSQLWRSVVGNSRLVVAIVDHVRLGYCYFLIYKVMIEQRQ